MRCLDFLGYGLEGFLIASESDTVGTVFTTHEHARSEIWLYLLRSQPYGCHTAHRWVDVQQNLATVICNDDGLSRGDRTAGIGCSNFARGMAQYCFWIDVVGPKKIDKSYLKSGTTGLRDLCRVYEGDFLGC